MYVYTSMHVYIHVYVHVQMYTHLLAPDKSLSENLRMGFRLGEAKSTNL